MKRHSRHLIKEFESIILELFGEKTNKIVFSRTKWPQYTVELTPQNIRLKIKENQNSLSNSTIYDIEKGSMYSPIPSPKLSLNDFYEKIQSIFEDTEKRENRFEIS